MFRKRISYRYAEMSLFGDPYRRWSVGRKSYFFKEAENVKAALDKGKEGNYLLIFDELFKGTNTVERIAINSAVFSELAKADNLILASTHDLELTGLLNNQYELYHFSEK